MIDTHCHLTFPDFEGRVPDVLRAAVSHGVTGCITISTTTQDCLAALRVAEEHAGVWCTAGVHPLYSDREPHAWANLRRVAQSPKCVAWGELGLDNHYDHPERRVQRRVLDEQLAFLSACAREGLIKPVVIHCRDAFADLIPVLRGSGLDAGRWVFHCFTGGPDEARQVLDFGAMISFTGVATYRNAGEVREAIRLVPDDRIMIETDAPFLSPEPKRGVRPCEPWMASVTARSVASTRGQDWDRFHTILNENTRRFFGISAE